MHPSVHEHIFCKDVYLCSRTSLSSSSSSMFMQGGKGHTQVNPSHEMKPVTRTISCGMKCKNNHHEKERGERKYISRQSSSKNVVLRFTFLQLERRETKIFAKNFVTFFPLTHFHFQTHFNPFSSLHFKLLTRNGERLLLSMAL